MRKFGVLLALLLTHSLLQANNVQITNVSFENSTNKLTFDISWENSWTHSGGIRDMVWIFVKQAPVSGPQWQHAEVDSISPPGNLFGFVSSDNKGAVVRRKFLGSSNITPSTVTLTLSGLVGPYQDFKVFAIEMVNVNEDPYYLGDAQSPGTFYEAADSTVPFLVSSDGPITFGSSSGQLNTNAFFPGLPATLPGTFANGYNTFFCMKYEVSQEQYVHFLNCLSRAQQQTRTETDLNVPNIVQNYVMTQKTVPFNRNGIRCEAGDPGTGPLTFYCDLNPANAPNSSDDGQHLAANYLSKNDLFAYLDWACLRPMSVFEYEKVCRGPLSPVPNEYAWGSAAATEPDSIASGEGTSAEVLNNVASPGPFGNPFTDLLARCGFAATDTSTRLTAGAGYYGAMEMSGNVSEIVTFDVNMNRDEFGDGALTFDGEGDQLPSFTYYASRGASTFSSGPMTVSQFPTIGAATSTGSSRTKTSGGRGVRKL